MNNMLLTKEVVKAAKALIGWNTIRLAEAAKMSVDTLKSFESGRTKALSAQNQDAVQKTLEAAGVQFIETGDTSRGVGVALTDSI